MAKYIQSSVDYSKLDIERRLGLVYTVMFFLKYGLIDVYCYQRRHTIRYDTIEEINVDSKAEYTA